MTSEAGTMVERIARALCWHDGPSPECLRRGECENSCDEPADIWRGFARAVLTALLDPTEEMERAGFLANRFTNPNPCGPTCVGRVTMPATDAFRAMIQAALQPGSKDKDG